MPRRRKTPLDSQTEPSTSTGLSTPSAMTKYRCAVGGEWKPLSMFSNTQQKGLHRSSNPAHTGMVCKEHATPSNLEHECSGPCQRVLTLNMFSAVSRRTEDWRCLNCVAWDSMQEPGVIPIPLPTGHISVEERTAEPWRAPTETAQFFDNGEQLRAPITSLEALGLNPTESMNRAFNQVTGRASQSGYISTGRAVTSTTSSIAGDNMSTTSSRATSILPPHLRPATAQPERMALQEDNASVSIKNTPPTASCGASGLPPHLRATNKLRQTTTSSSAGSISTATTVRNDKEEAVADKRIMYNAWDPTGNRHTAAKTPTVMSSSGSTAEENGSSSNSNWGNVTPAPEVSYRGSGSKWPKSSELRISQTDLRRQSQESFHATSKWPKSNELRIPRSDVEKDK